MIKQSKTLMLLAGVGVAALAAAFGIPRVSAETMQRVPSPAKDEVPMAADGLRTAVLAGGCFWGVQGVFQHVKGVTNAVSGYAGGTQADASYDTVSSGQTGHAEAVSVTYDPKVVSYGTLLQIYFSVVTDPTTLNFQGPDHGPQYRSDIFAATPEQSAIATAYIAQLQAAHVYPAPIVTKVSSLSGFYPAEGYHQNYLTEHPHNPYIARNDMPKVEGLKDLFQAAYRPSPVLTAATN